MKPAHFLNNVITSQPRLRTLSHLGRADWPALHYSSKSPAVPPSISQLGPAAGSILPLKGLTSTNIPSYTSQSTPSSKILEDITMKRHFESDSFGDKKAVYRPRSKSAFASIDDRSRYKSIPVASKKGDCALYRPDVPVATPPPTTSTFSLPFSVTSYNILAQHYLQTNLHLYKHCHRGVLDWDYRWANLLDEIQAINSDIYCLQEVQWDHYERDIEPAMSKLGYSGLYQRKTNNKPDGCAIFYRTSLFSVSRYSGLTFYRPATPSLAFDNTGQVVLLRPTNSPDTVALCVANTHLFFSPNRGDVKSSQLCLLLAEIEAIARIPSSKSSSSSPNYHPIILCGDFNLEPHSPLYRFLVNGRLPLQENPICYLSGQNESSFSNKRNTDDMSMDGVLPHSVAISNNCVYHPTSIPRRQDNSNHTGDIDDAISISSDSNQSSPDAISISSSPISTSMAGEVTHSLGLAACHDYSSRHEPRLVTSFTTLDTCAVDHIFYSPQSNLHLTAYKSLATPRTLEAIGGLPNRRLSSDHLPLVTQFLLTDAQSATTSASANSSAAKNSNDVDQTLPEL